MTPNDRSGELVRVIVVSPGDVADERAAVKLVVDELNRRVAPSHGCQLSLWRWETDARPGLHLEGPQGLIDERMEISESDVVVGIFWKRFGTPTGDARSGTEHELRKAWEAWRQSGRPDVMVYFSQQPAAPTTSVELEQWHRVVKFREELPKEQLWWSYTTPVEFERLVREHLEDVIVRRASTERSATMRSVSAERPITGSKTAKVFISYRQTDTTSGYASWIYDKLAESFGVEQVFMVDSLPLGVDFVEHLQRALDETDVALILIGPGWLDAKDDSGHRRLDDPDDFVHVEVAAALRASARVIPVLVDGASMPTSSLLPEDLRTLSRRQALTFHRQGGTAIRQLLAVVHKAASERGQRGDSAQAQQRGDVPASGAPSNATPSGAARGLAVQRLGRNNKNFPSVGAPCATRDLLPTIPVEDRACVTSLHGDCLPIWGIEQRFREIHAALKRGHVILFHNGDVIFAAGEVACTWKSDKTSRAVGWKGLYPLIVSFTRTMTGREIKVREFKRDVSPFPDPQHVLELDANLYHRLNGAIWAGDSRKIAVFRRGVPCEPRDLPSRDLA